MATKRPSKQKRAAQNRNQRAARVARAANANAAARPAGGSGSGSSGRGGLLGRLRGGGGTGSTSTRARGAALRPDTPPGFRAALSAVFAAVAALFLLALILRYPVDGQGDVYTPETLTADWSLTALDAIAEQPDADADAGAIAESIDEWAPGRDSQTALQALWPFSLAGVLPLIGAGLGFQAVRKRASSKVVNRALYATLFGAVLTQGLLLLFLPVVLGMGLAMFQVRRAEMIARASDAGTEDVIDVEAYEDDEAELLDDEDERTDVIDVDAIDLDAPEDGPSRA